MAGKIMKWAAVIFAIVVVISAVRFYSGEQVPVDQVQRVEFQGWSSCGGPVSDEVELSESEIRELVRRYNKAKYVGEVTGEACDSKFNFTIYMKDGTKIFAKEAGAPRIQVTAPSGDRSWVRSKDLAAYAQELIEKYGLMASPEE